MPHVKGDPTVTDARGADQRLAGAFRAAGDIPGTEVSEDLRDRIWLAVSGALPPEERRELIERTATDPGSAEAWRIAHELWLASEASAAREAAAVMSRRAGRWMLPWLAAAAALLLATAIGVASLLNRPAGEQFRAPRGYTVESLVAPGTALPAGGFRLRWTPGPAGSRYQVRVTTEDLQVLTTAADLTLPEFVVDPAILSRLPSGADVFWQLDVALPNGERITSPTFVTPLE